MSRIDFNTMYPVLNQYNAYANYYGNYGSYTTPYTQSNYQVSNNTPQAEPLQKVPSIYHTAYVMPFQNKLKNLFHNRQAVIYALNLRTFGAIDTNANGKIEPRLGENGTFLKAMRRLPELKALGINTIHLLPINPIGLIGRLGLPGAPGSLYSPSTLEAINGEFDEASDPRNVVEEAKQFVEAAHRYGIHVMADIPSCGSIDLQRSKPELFARDEKGRSLTPTNWVDIRMFVKDSPELRHYYGKWFKTMAEEIGVDGFRADVARARSNDFWKHFINKYPNKAWLAESYVEEDASPMKNIPRDIPGEFLKLGFDAIYGQYHIFHNWRVSDYMNYVTTNRQYLNSISPQKSIIGSFATHDDPSVMNHGGPTYCKLATGLMMTQPDTNPYILDGFLTGYDDHYDIFNYKPPLTGNYPDIGEFFKRMGLLRQQYQSVITKGKFIPLQASNPNVIAYLRQYGNKSLLIVANKNVNASERAEIKIPGLQVEQKLTNLAPEYGDKSAFVLDEASLMALPISPGKFYMFDVNLPPIAEPEKPIEK